MRMKSIIALALVSVMGLTMFTGCKKDNTQTVETVPMLVTDGSTLTYNEFMATNYGEQVTVAGYVQAKMAYISEGQNTSLFVKDQTSDNAYFIYNAIMTQDVYNSITEGTPIKITGTKNVFNKQIQIANATVEVLSGTPVVTNPIDITTIFASSASDYLNRKIQLTGFTVETFSDGAVFHYGYNGSGSNGDAIFFNASYNGVTYLFTVNNYLTDPSTEVYTAVQNLQAGQTITIQGYMYVYENPMVQVTSIT